MQHNAMQFQRVPARIQWFEERDPRFVLCKSTVGRAKYPTTHTRRTRVHSTLGPAPRAVSVASALRCRSLDSLPVQAASNRTAADLYTFLSQIIVSQANAFFLVLLAVFY